ncbi:MAG: hypothetical protein II972_02195, partial [Elusimicrobiaceae bacterium]|nr:hypothetical protein [Elusimicrobiaceae bacterium]
MAYQIEVGNGYFRFYKDHELILKNGSAYEVQTGYALADLFDTNGVLQLDYQQSGDVLYLVHDKYPPRKLSRYADDNWTLADLDIKGGPWQNMNADETQRIKASADNGVVNLSTLIGGDPVCSFDSIDAWYPGSPYPMVSYALTIYCNGSQIARVERNTSTNNFAAVAAELINSSVSDWIATNPTLQSLSITAINNQNTYKNKSVQIKVYTYSSGGAAQTKNTYSSFYSDETEVDVFTENMVGMPIRLTQTDTIVPAWYSGKTISSTGTIVKSDGKYYSAESTGTCGSVKPTHTEGSENDGGVVWKYLHSGYGWGVITEYISATSAKMRVYGQLPAGIVSVGTWKWELGLFGYEGIWPSSVAFFKDRLAFGINALTGPQICFSCTGDYENFADMENGEVLATSAITLPILSDLNKINWLCAQDNLFVGTEGGILAVKAMTSSEVFGPDNITYDNISSVGACKIKPIRIGDDVLYLGRLAKDIYAIQYNWESDSYTPDEISLMAYDLLEAGIKAWTLQYEPNRIIWAVRNDGKLIGLTYNKKQEVRGFHWHETAGTFESVSCIPAPDGTADEVYAVVKRSVNNADVRYVEYLKNGLPLNIPSGLTKAQMLTYLLKNCWFLDCAKKYTFDEATDTITGLDHLEGKSVAVLADGKVQGSKIVSSGSITLDSAANIVLVG